MRRLFLVVTLCCLAAPAAARPLGNLNFSDCRIEVGGNTRTDAECARLKVPENPDQPDGRRIELRIALLRARAAQPQPDPVLFLAGGPGQSAIDAFPAVAVTLAPLARERHVLLLDQRGTGGSNALHCPLPDVFDEGELSPASARIQAFDCLRQLSERADPEFYTTSHFLRDIEAVRAAIGARQLNLIGGSYGTRVALEYLRRHEAAVRTVVLDSVVPPELALMQDHPRNLDEALNRTFTLCREDKACSERFGDPAQTLARLRRTVTGAGPRLQFRDPRDHRVRQARFNGGVLAGVVRLFSYAPEGMSLLPLLLDEAAAGHPEIFLAQVSRFTDFARDMAHGMELSVICAEDAPFARVDPDDASRLLGNDMVRLIQAQCEVWPSSEVPPGFKEPVRSTRPVLVLSGELDPVTPPRYGEQVLRTLPRGRQIVARGQGHIVMTRGCLPRLVRHFVESADTRGLDAGCVQSLGYQPAFTGFQGPPP